MADLERDHALDESPPVDKPGFRTDDGESHATTGGSAVAGAVTGGVIGLAGGPVAAVVGAIGGAIVGAATERVMHAEDDEDEMDPDHDEVHDTAP